MISIGAIAAARGEGLTRSQLLTDAELTGVNLSDTILFATSLTSAKLYDAKLRGEDLRRGRGSREP